MKRIVGVTFWAFLLLLGAAGVGAAEGITVESDSTFEVLPGDGVVHVEAVYTLTNVTPSTTRGFVTTRYFYDRYGIPLPSEAINVVATSSGRDLNLEMETVEAEDNFTYELAVVTFRRKIFNRQTTVFTLSYDIPGDEPRSDGGIRINPAYMHFFADGIGDDGKVSVRILIPRDYEIETFGDFVSRSSTGDVTTLEAIDIENPREWYVQISARKDEALFTRNLIVGDRSLELQFWPGDDDWADFVHDRTTTGIPILEELIGRPWPDEDVLEVQESFVPLLYGYAGWYTSSLDRIELTEELDQQVLYHELSHVWFNAKLFDERWINEGLADEFAALVMKHDGFSISPRPIYESDPGYVLLNLWDTPWGSLGDDDIELREQFGYNASWWMLHQVSKEIGAEGLGRAMDMAFDGTIAYVGETEPEKVDHGSGWKRFLDVLELGGGSEIASELFVENVLIGLDHAIVTERAEAREAYEEFAELSGSWAVPFGIRDAMDAWDFEVALDLMSQAELALAVRTEVEFSATELGLAAPAVLEAPYEVAEDSFEEIVATGESQLEAMAEIVIAAKEVAIERDFFAEIGLRGEDLVLELQAARDAFEANEFELVFAEAQAVIAHSQDMERVGKRRVAWVLLAVGLSLLFVLIVILLIRRCWQRRRRREIELGDVPPMPDASREPTLELPVIDEETKEDEIPCLQDS